MPKVSYVKSSLNTSLIAIVNNSIKIIEEYESLKIFPTLRGLYYRMIARDLFPESWRDKKTRSKNNPLSYKKFGYLISKARLVGIIDWHSVEDRTRFKIGISHWKNPDHILKAVPGSFQLDHWKNQKFHPEVWIEKDALSGVISNTCKQLDVDYFACKGYVSQSAMWNAAQRFIGYISNHQVPLIIHLGDHDPSGLDMTRDIANRLHIFQAGGCVVHRIALNINQVKKYKPPPDPAKFTDPRFKDYIPNYGRDAWELDALDPVILCRLIKAKVLEYRDENIYLDILEQEEKDLDILSNVAKNWRSLLK